MDLSKPSFLVQFTAQNNDFSSMTEDICDLGVFSGGELVEFKIACDICLCDSFMCDFCQE